MARYPGARWRPLPENATQARITPRLVILHTAVSTADSLYPYFSRDSVHVESTFYVQSDGGSEQYMDTNRRADCNRDANGFAISVETEDNGASDPADIPPWTKAQFAALVELVAWCCRTHGIPAVKAGSWDGQGIGYHRQFSGDPGWNRNHACPGPARIAQMPALIAAVKAKLSTPKPQPTPAPVVARLEDYVMAEPAQLCQAEGDAAIYAITLSGAVHVKNSYHLTCLQKSGQVTEKIWPISKAQLAQLLEKE